MHGGIQASLGRAIAIFLIGLVLLASGAPCTPAAFAAGPSASSFDPCRRTQAPAPQCAQIACKTFAVPATPATCPPALAAFVPFRLAVRTAVGRLVRPPLPPPRASMV
jgi:hypothetical protein